MATSNACCAGLRQSNFGRKTCQGLNFVLDKLGLGHLQRIWRVFVLSLRRLAEVSLVILFVIIVISIWGLHLYHGLFKYNCVPRIYSTQRSETAILCGLSSRSKSCPSDQYCRDGEENPNYGYTNFDHFGWSLVSGLRLASYDYWEGLYHIVRDTKGVPYIIYFVIVVTITMLLIALFPSVFLLTLFEMNEKDAKKKSAGKNEVNVSGTEVVNDKNPQHFTSIKVETEEHDKSTIQIIDLEEERIGIENEKEGPSVKNGEEVTFTSRHLKTKHPKCTDTNCFRIICLFSCLDGIRSKISLIVFDPFVELFVTVVVIVNVVALTLDHYYMPVEYVGPLTYSNYVFTVVVTVEAALKIFAMSPGCYFRNSWNILDIIIVVSSIFHYISSSSVGFSLLFLLAAVRLLKLGRLWPTLYKLLEVFSKTDIVLWNFVILIGVISVIIAAIGMRIFSWYYYNNSKSIDNRWNFGDFMHSWMIIFRISCGEWIELAWDGMKVYGVSAFLFFLVTFIIGHLLLVYLFLAFLINAGNSDFPKRHEQDDSQIIFAAVDRFSNIGRWIKSRCTCQKPNEIGHVVMENDEGEDMEMDIIQVLQARARPEDAPPRCCPDPIYSSSICWNNHSQFAQKVRKACYVGIQKPWFERTVHVFIIIYSIFLAFESADIKYNPTLKTTLLAVHIIMGCVFIFEMFIRWTGNGIKLYFSDLWCWIDFVVIISFVTEFFLYRSGHEIHPFLRAIRVIRILRLIREFFIFENARAVLNSLIQALPGTLNVGVMGAFYWLIFAQIFVQVFAGKFYACVDEDGEPLDAANIPDLHSCMLHNFTWMNSYLHFDDISESFFTLLHVAAIKGWVTVLHNAADGSEIHQQPIKESNIYVMLALVIFIIFGSWLMYSLLIGVILDGYHRQKDMIDSDIDGLNKGEKMYSRLQEKIKTRNALMQAHPKPQHGLQAKIYNFVMNDKFDIAVTCTIVLSTVALALVNDQLMAERVAYSSALIGLYGLFLAVFAIECGLKFFALRINYFKCTWNVVDFVAVILGLADIFTRMSISSTVFPPLLLRFFRIPRRITFLNTCKQAFKIALPRLLTVLFLLFLVIYVYAIFGMALFRPDEEAPYEVSSFQTFSSALDQGFAAAYVMSSYQMLTSTAPIGRAVTSGFILSFALITYVFLMATLFVFVMVSYHEANEKVEDDITIQDIDRFYANWQKFDLYETGYIKNVDLHAFLNVLEKPLQISNPNKYKIGAMDIPLCKEDMVYHGDVLDSLIRNCLAEKGLDIRREVLLEKFSLPNDQRYQPISSTLWRQREQKCAYVIQKWWKFTVSKRVRKYDL